MQSDPVLQPDFELDASPTGTFQVSLTRAVVPYHDRADRGLPGGRVQDIGLGVVVDGRDPARADVLDLGSAEVRLVDVTGPLAVLGWIYPSGLRTLQRAIGDASGEDQERARAYTMNIALRALEGAAFGPLTRPTFLRIGFRDICQDLDLHEGTAIRLRVPSESVARLHFDYEAVTLVARLGRDGRSPELELGLADAFPGCELLLGALEDPVGAPAYHIPFPIPRDLADVRTLLSRLRAGALHLLARFEAERHRLLLESLNTFGERDSLRSLQDRVRSERLERIVPGGRGVGVENVH